MKTTTTSEKSNNRIGIAVVLLSIITSFSLPAQNVKMLLTESWQNNAWNNAARTNNVYHENRLESTTTQTWNGQSWENNLKETNSYDSNGNVAETLTQLWNAYKNDWENAQRKTNSHTTSGKVLKEVTETYEAGRWEATSQIINEYDADGFQIKSIAQNWDVQTKGWSNNAQSLQAYNGNGTVNRITIQTWNLSIQSWNNAERKLIDYDASGKELNSLSQIWESGNWTNLSQEVNIYDNGQMVSANTQVWLPFRASWETDSQYSYTHNNDGTINQSLTQSKAGNSWDNEMRFTFVYDTPDAYSVAFRQH
jgi:hypothetical protein